MHSFIIILLLILYIVYYILKFERWMASHYCISQCSPPTGWKRPQLWHYLGVPSKFCPRLATSQWYEGQFWALCLIMSSYDLATVTVYSHPRSRLDVNTQKCKPFWWWSDSGSPRVVQWILQAEPLHRSQASWSPSGMFDWSPKKISFHLAGFI